MEDERTARIRGKSAPLICTDGHLYGHQTLHGFEFTNEFAGSSPVDPATQFQKY
ncbi:uncharacterized protein METZ01_LOCUS110258 [marine metagenome]|uniref:Uncharacterized protein n=1 Tax=marine metagenome TaxID=408172 RepID=A0A381WY33_9ZZZZ